MFSNLPEALERWEGWEQGQPYDPGTLDVVLEAARLVARIWTTCPTCGGRAKVFWEHTDISTGDHAGTAEAPCPDCVGGLVPTEEALAEVASSLEFEGLLGARRVRLAHDVLRGLLEYGIDE